MVLLPLQTRFTATELLWTQRCPHRRLCRPSARWIRLRKQASISESQPSAVGNNTTENKDDSREPIVVVGLGRSGRAAAALAAFKGERVIAIDTNPASKPVELDSDLDVSGSIETRVGEHSHSDALFDSAKTVILSPGVPYTQAHIARLLASCPEKVVSEMSYAAQGLPVDFPVAAITGTNGKSTVTTFVQQLLTHALSSQQAQDNEEGIKDKSGRVFAGGNLGSSLSELVLSMARGERWDAAAIECSSYQLEHGVLPLRPMSAAILNLTPDHLERHKTMQAYAQAKSRIFEACLDKAERPARGEEKPLLVLPADCPQILTSAVQAALNGVQEAAGYDLAYVGKFPGAVIKGDPGCREIQIQIKDVSVTFQTSTFRPLGSHNLENAAAALLLTIGILLSCDMAERIPDLETALATLSPPAHRMEIVGESSNGVLYVNDSKATNVESVLVALSGIGRRSVVLLGGIAKRLKKAAQGTDETYFGFERLVPLLQDNHHIGVVCFGSDGLSICEELTSAGYPSSNVQYVHGGLRAAVQKARELTPPSCAVLLSPGCASFDEFDNFMARGEQFVSMVKEESGELKR